MQSSVLQPIATAIITLSASVAFVYVGGSLPAYGDEVDDVHEQIAVLEAGGGPELMAATEALYQDLHRQASRDGVEVTRGIRYGIYEHQTLDIYAPADRGEELLPVVVFVHGGNLTNGDKDGADNEEFLYGNVATFFARNGFIGVNANYRLVPDVVWPQGAEDMREILGWLVTENAEEYGGDPGAMFMMGTLGGARHLASYLFYRPAQMVLQTRLMGAILNSAPLAPSASESSRLYYGEDEAVRERLSPLGLMQSHEGDRVPILLLSAENEPAGIEISTAQMYAGLCSKYEDCPRFEQLENHNQYSGVASFNTTDETVSMKVLEFIRDLYESRDRQ